MLLNLSLKFWNSAFNAQGSRRIILAVQVGAVRIYVAAVEALRKKERQGEAFTPRLMLMYLFEGYFWMSPRL
jgi:hypothetical protein